jgi:hypothetical protein
MKECGILNYFNRITEDNSITDFPQLSKYCQVFKCYTQGLDWKLDLFDSYKP